MFRDIARHLRHLFDDIREKDWVEARYDLASIRSDLTYPFYNLYRQLRCLWSYLPVLWNDRDWDHVYLFDLMRHKLIRMEKCLETSDLLNGHRYATQVRKVIMLLDRIRKDEYMENATLLHDAKWGEAHVEFKDLGEDKRSGLVDIIRSQVKTERDEEKEREEFRRCMAHAHYMEQQDLEYFGRLLTKHVKCWWT